MPVRAARHRSAGSRWLPPGEMSERSDRAPAGPAALRSGQTATGSSHGRHHRMNTPPSPSGAGRTDGSSSVRIGVLVPLTRPGWAEAGRHLLAGLELAVRDVNDADGIAGRPVELVVRDTAADPQRAAAAVDELARLGVAALAGSITASSPAPLPPGPTPSACRSSARQRFSTRSPNSRRNGSRASPRRSPTAGGSTRTSSSARATVASPLQPSRVSTGHLGPASCGTTSLPAAAPSSNSTCARSPPRRCATHSSTITRQPFFSWSATRSRQCRSSGPSAVTGASPTS